MECADEPGLCIDPGRTAAASNRFTPALIPRPHSPPRRYTRGSCSGRTTLRARRRQRPRRDGAAGRHEGASRSVLRQLTEEPPTPFLALKAAADPAKFKYYFNIVWTLHSSALFLLLVFLENLAKPCVGCDKHA